MTFLWKSCAMVQYSPFGATTPNSWLFFLRKVLTMMRVQECLKNISAYFSCDYNYGHYRRTLDPSSNSSLVSHGGRLLEKFSINEGDGADLWWQAPLWNVQKPSKDSSIWGEAGCSAGFLKERIFQRVLCILDFFSSSFLASILACRTTHTAQGVSDYSSSSKSSRLVIAITVYGSVPCVCTCHRVY